MAWRWYFFTSENLGPILLCYRGLTSEFLFSNYGGTGAEIIVPVSQTQFTGWFKANLDTLTVDYDEYTMCFEKIVVELFSVHMDISFHSNKSEKK